MATIKSVPITLITGYLGSGKTTLVNYILRNSKNYKMAVIVNDIGEVNIDAELIAKDGVVSGKDDSLVALQNGCICCTLKKDLIEQLADLVQSQKFDHILIEASGICEPVPIAQTISFMEEEFRKQGLPRFYYLDAIVSVTDALRLRDEFEGLESTKRGEEDLENLVIQQIEFCDVIILNKVGEISKVELDRVKKTIRAIQPKAKIIDANFCEVDLDEIVNTNLFDFESASTSAAWIKEFEDWDNEVDSDEMEHEHHHHHHDDDDDDDDEHEHHHHEEHEHHHHHHHHHGTENEEEGTADEYDINTFVYYRRRPFAKADFKKWCEENVHHLIRSKGILYFKEEPKEAYVYEQAGRQQSLKVSGRWYSESLTKKQLKMLIESDANFAHDWDEKYGDKLIKLVFIGQNLNKEKIREELDQI